MHKSSIDFLTGLCGRTALPYSCDVFAPVITSLRQASAPLGPRLRPVPKLPLPTQPTTTGLAVSRSNTRGVENISIDQRQPKSIVLLLSFFCTWTYHRPSCQSYASSHLANGRYGFRSKLPMVGDPGVKLPKTFLS